MPHFFIYAKGYDAKQVVSANDSLMSKLEKYIKNKRLTFKNFARFDYHKLMSNPSIEINAKLIDTYISFIRKYHIRINNLSRGKDNLPFLMNDLREQLLQFGYTELEIVDMLIEHLYGETDSKYKNVLWYCYGDIILENIKQNVDTSKAVCMRCGRRFEKSAPNHRYCDHCHLERIKKDTQKIRVCKDCGREFLVDISVRNKPRCDDCQLEADRKREREKKRKQRALMDVPTF